VKYSDSATKRKISYAVVSSISVFSILAIYSFAQSSIKPTFPYRTQILAGLSDQSEFSRNSIDQTMAIVAKYSSGGIWSFCISGLPTVATGTYASKDKWLWNLQPEPWMLRRWTQVNAGDFMYICSLSPGEQLILTRNLSLGNVVLVEEGDGFAIYQARQGLQ
jgi:hypothetical protein